MSSSSSITLGSYHLRERVGEGGTAHVYRAEGPGGRPVAVKLLAPQAELDDQAARQRLEREIRVLAGLRHAHVIELLDHGVDDELGPYLVTPLVTGTSLRALAAGAPLCPEAALLLWLPVLDALAALHGAGLVHRDLKPENVLVTPAGRLLLIDLGLAYQPGQSRYTEEGAVIGSAPYMAPEQIEGAAVTGAVDVWAAGVMAYEWLAGRRPFARPRLPEDGAAILVGSFPPLRAAERRASDELGALIESCLRRDPAARPPAAELHAAGLALVDWVEAAGREAELAAVVRDPAGYAARVAPFRVTRLKRQARQAIESGEPFAALRAIDRALAYVPEDAELRALSEKAEAASPSRPPPLAPAAEPARAARRRAERTVAVTLAAAILAAGLAAVSVALWMRRGHDAPAAAAARPAPAAAPDPALAIFGGMMSLFERGLAAQERANELKAREPGAPAASASVSASATGKDAAATEALRPIPPTALSDHDPPHGLDMKARPGDQLLPAALLLGRSPEAALAEAERKVAETHGSDVARHARAMVLMAAGREAEGLRQLDALLKERPGYAAGWAARGFVELRRGRWDAADRAFSRAIELDPTDAETLRNRGILRHRRGRTRAAYQDLTAALERDPDDVDALAELSQIYERAGRRADARPLLQRIVRLRPRSAGAWLDLSLTQSPAEALASIDRAIAAEPDLPRAHQRRCSVLARLGDARAEAACSRSIELASDNPDAWMDRGLARYGRGDDRAALEDMDRAIALEGDRATFFTNRYLVRAHAGQTEAARRDLATACKLGAEAACAEMRKQ